MYRKNCILEEFLENSFSEFSFDFYVKGRNSRWTDLDLFSIAYASNFPSFPIQSSGWLRIRSLGDNHPINGAVTYCREQSTVQLEVATQIFNSYARVGVVI